MPPGATASLAAWRHRALRFEQASPRSTVIGAPPAALGGRGQRAHPAGLAAGHAPAAPSRGARPAPSPRGHGPAPHRAHRALSPPARKVTAREGGGGRGRRSASERPGPWGEAPPFGVGVVFLERAWPGGQDAVRSSPAVAAPGRPRGRTSRSQRSPAGGARGHPGDPRAGWPPSGPARRAPTSFRSQRAHEAEKGARCGVTVSANVLGSHRAGFLAERDGLTDSGGGPCVRGRRGGPPPSGGRLACGQPRPND